jgi:hypothetical protein
MPPLITMQTTEIHPSYAPDVKIAGAAFGGLAPNGTYTTGNSPIYFSIGQ